MSVFSLPPSLLPPPLRCRAVRPQVRALPDLNRDPLRRVFSAGPPPRSSAASVPCRTSTASLCGQCSLPDLNCDLLCPVFFAGPQPGPSAASVPCRTSTATCCAQCSLPDLNRDHLRSVFPAGPQPRDRMSEDMSERTSERMSEDCLQSVCEVESNRTHFRR